MPTNSAIPTRATGNVLSSGDWNTLTPLNSAVGLYGRTSGLVGSVPVTGAPNFQIQAGTYVGTTTSGGSLSIPLPSTFPNGLLTVLVSVGDNAASLGQVQINAASNTTSSFGVLCWTLAGAVVNAGTVRINYIAIGF
jgi:hypothetical protein